MNILVTGAKGFLGKNIVENLKTIKDGRNKTRPNIMINNIYEFDQDNTIEELDLWCSDADFVFNLAGVNRTNNPEDFKKGNFGFASTLLDILQKHNNKAPIMLSSSVQATLLGRFGVSEYGLSKLEGEELFFDYANETGVNVYVYRFPNIVGKWGRPNYNSAVVTFCYNIAHDLPIRVDNPETELELLFIDDLIEEMYNALEGKPNYCDYPDKDSVIDGICYDGVTPRWLEDGRYCGVTTTHRTTLGEIVSLLQEFHSQPKTLLIPEMAKGSFEKKLFSMYLSYLPVDKIVSNLTTHSDERGSFTEVFKTEQCGQFSVNVINPGRTKGEHWHNSKWEMLIVVSGRALIKERRIDSDEVYEFEVSGESLKLVFFLPGYTHQISNVSDTDNLVALIWANEVFDPDYPDTYREEV